MVGLIVGGPVTDVAYAVSVEEIQQTENRTRDLKEELKITRKRLQEALQALERAHQQTLDFEGRRETLEGEYDTTLTRQFKEAEAVLWESEQRLAQATTLQAKAEETIALAQTEMKAAYDSVDKHIASMAGVTDPERRQKMTDELRSAREDANRKEEAFWEARRAAAAAKMRVEWAGKDVQTAGAGLQEIGQKAPELMAMREERNRRLAEETSAMIEAEKQRRLLVQQTREAEMAEELTQVQTQLDQEHKSILAAHTARLQKQQEITAALSNVDGQLGTTAEMAAKVRQEKAEAAEKIQALEVSVAETEKQGNELREAFVAQEAEQARQQAEAERIERERQEQEVARLKLQEKLERKARYAAMGPQWRFSAGPTYRFFDDIEFGQAPFRGWGNQNADDTFVTGPDKTAPLPPPLPGPWTGSDDVIYDGVYGVQGVSNPVDTYVRDNRIQGQTAYTPDGLAEEVWVDLDYIRFDGASDSIDSFSGTGVALSMDRKILTRPNWVVRVTGGLQYFHPSSSESYDGDMNGAAHFTTEQYRHTIADSEAGPQLDNSDIVINPATQQVTVNSSTVYDVEEDFDMDLIVLDLGLSIAYTRGKWEYELGTGPTINLIPSFDTSQHLWARWDDIESSSPNPPYDAGAPVVIDGGTYNEHHSDSTSDVLFGGYLSAGVTYALTEHSDVAARFRYDFVSGSVRTDLARMDLDSLSLQFSWIYHF